MNSTDTYVAERYATRAIVLSLSFLLLSSLPTFQFSAQTYVTISGKVVDDSWSEIEGVRVKAQSFGGSEFDSFTDREGLFRFVVPIDRFYTLFYSKKGFWNYAEVVNIGAGDVFLGSRVLRPILASLELSSPSTGYTLKAGERAKIPFTVRNLQSSNATITFKFKAPQGWSPKVVDASGSAVESLDLSAAGNTSSSASLSILYDVPLSAGGYYTLRLQIHQNQTTAVDYVLNVQPLKDDELVYAAVKNLVVSDASIAGFDITLANPSQNSIDVPFNVEAPEGWNYTTIVGASSASAVALKPKDSVSVKALISVPTGTAPGTYSLAFKADFASFKVTLPLRVTVNLKERAFSISDFLFVPYPHLVSAPRESVRFSLKLMNPYDTVQYADLEVGVPQGWTYVIMGDSNRIQGLSLNAKQSANIDLYVNTPSEAEDGTYIIPFTARSSNINVQVPLKITVSRTIAYPGDQIELTTTNPYREVYGGRSVGFDLTIENNGDEPDLVDLALTGLPKDFTATFQDSKGQDISRIYVVNGSRSSFSLTVAVPETASMGTVPFNVTATGRRVSTRLPLTLEVAGKYSLSIKTQNLFTSLTVGSKGTFSIAAVNDGTQDLTNVRVEVPGASLPTGLNITSTPTAIAVLRRGDQATFVLEIQSTTDLTVGTYPVLFTVVSDKAKSSQYYLTIQAVQSSNILLIGLGIVLAGVAAVVLVFRRMGRR